MDNLKLYEINGDYITYLSAFAPHLFKNKKTEQKNERKYIGIVLQINGFDYFAPLSSFKDKHKLMKEVLDFIKVKDYAVINLNNMFPVPLSETKYVDISSERDPRYRALLLAEYRYIKSIQEKIWKNARNVYKLKIKNGEASSLSKRCNDFLLLEKACADYIK
ncbi:MAG: type III toxin-antitoxin system ToxN/AbiQ family toxin [Clostridia bacterium]|nr:type III toxin-antitoxin system ToxN/AbiQ family toxin [Clostridia bacterium]